MEIRYMFVGIPVAAYFLVWILGAFYPINHKKHYQILKQLKYAFYFGLSPHLFRDISEKGDIDTSDTGVFVPRDSAYSPAISAFDNTATVSLKKSQFELLMRRRTTRVLHSSPTIVNFDSNSDVRKPKTGEEGGGAEVTVGTGTGGGQGEKVADDDKESSSSSSTSSSSEKSDGEKGGDEGDAKDVGDNNNEENTPTNDNNTTSTGVPPPSDDVGMPTTEQVGEAAGDPANLAEQ